MGVDNDLDKFERGALFTMGVLEHQSVARVAGIALAEKSEALITSKDVLAIIERVGRTVLGIRAMVRKEFKKFLDIESRPESGRNRRDVRDILKGIGHVAFCFELGHDLLKKT